MPTEVVSGETVATDREEETLIKEVEEAEVAADQDVRKISDRDLVVRTALIGLTVVV